MTKTIKKVTREVDDNRDIHVRIAERFQAWIKRYPKTKLKRRISKFDEIADQELDKVENG